MAFLAETELGAKERGLSGLTLKMLNVQPTIKERNHSEEVHDSLRNYGSELSYYVEY